MWGCGRVERGGVSRGQIGGALGMAYCVPVVWCSTVTLLSTGGDLAYKSTSAGLGF